MSNSKLQKIFNIVFTGLKGQGFCRSVTAIVIDNYTMEQCVYKNESGRSCAAGHLIPDTDYSHDMEGRSASSLPFFRDKYDEEGLEFISHLQGVHDNNPDPDLMHEALITAANRYDVAVPKCN